MEDTKIVAVGLNELDRYILRRFAPKTEGLLEVYHDKKKEIYTFSYIGRSDMRRAHACSHKARLRAAEFIEKLSEYKGYQRCYYRVSN